jgi:hypothetical protein
LRGLAVFDPTDLNVAGFFVYAFLGADYDDSPYSQTGERVARLAVSGIRLVIEDFRTDVTKTRKDGSRGTLRIDYGDPRSPSDPIAWMWRFIDGAKTAGELCGRALVVIAAEQHACRLVVAQSQRSHPARWSSHKDHAAKTLAKLAGPHVPASLRRLEKAIAHAHRETSIEATASHVGDSDQPSSPSGADTDDQGRDAQSAPPADAGAPVPDDSAPSRATT